MRYLSLFSGVEAASLAWKPLGWECAAVSEIEPFPCAVLKHHYPSVPNLGDVTKITQPQIEALGHIDVIVFGAPCQDLSVAGKQKGLKNADGSLTRSGLFFNACQIAEWSKARWAIWENVPGAFSSNGGRDFAAVVGELSGVEIDVPGDGWENSGVALGPKGLVEWVTLDAQFVRVEPHPRAVPQRRRRIFVIRDSGDWKSRAPLFLEPEGLCGNPPPRREAREGVAETLNARTKGGGGLGTDFELGGGSSQKSAERSLTEPTMGGGLTGKTHIPVESYQSLSEATREVAQALTSNYGKQPDNSDTAQGPNLVVEELIAFDTTQITSKTNRCNPQPGDPCHPVVATGHPPAVAYDLRGREGGAQFEGPHDTANIRAASGGSSRSYVAETMKVRRLTPTECEVLMGMPHGYTAIPHNGKPAADGPRYKAVGNSMAVNVMRLIGERIQRASA